MKRFIQILPWLGALLLIAFALLSSEADLLWKVQQYNTFLDTPLYFREQMLVPGGFLSYVGSYFTQFFFHPWVGVLMLCGWWLLLMWLTKRTFRIPGSWVVVALIPVAMLLVMDMSLGYWHYFMRLRGYFFVPTLGTTAAVVMLWAFRALPQKLRIGWVVLTAAVGYPLFGAYVLAAVVLMGVWTWRLWNSPKQNGILTLVAVLCLVAIPLFCYRYVYYQIYSGDLWTAALPSFTAIESHPVYYIPYYILGAFFLLMVVCYQRSLTGRWQKPLFRWGLQGVLVAALIAGVWHWWYKDANFHHELIMQQCIEQADWEGVLREGQKQGEVEPTRGIVMMYNLALSRLGRQLDEMYSFPKGNAKNNTPLTYNMLYHVFGRLVYYHYGMLNDCHRLCMEDGVEYGWRVELQEYLTRCSLLMGETQAAQKFVNLLRHTQYHGEWADAMQQLIDHPEQIAQHRELGVVSRMLHHSNALGSDAGQVERYVMSQLAREDSDDLYFQEQAVIAALWMRNSSQFFARFGQYARLLPAGSPMPRIFQEAAYLFGKMEDMPNIDKFPFDKNIVKTYNAFMKEAAKYNNRDVSLGRVALYPFYGNTYFYEYHFLKYSH